MQNGLTYQTSFMKDSYFICKDNLQIGKLYKGEWLGSTIDATTNEHSFRFVSKGFFRPAISITDKKTKHIIGTVAINNFFKFSPSATLSLINNKCYAWTTKGIFSFGWKWVDLANEQIIATSTEPLDILGQSGTIELPQQNEQTELLIALGIHLRNVVQRTTVMTRIIAFVSLTLSLLNHVK